MPRKHIEHEKIPWDYKHTPPEELIGFMFLVLVESAVDGEHRVQIARYDGECLRGTLWMEQDQLNDDGTMAWSGPLKGVKAWS